MLDLGAPVVPGHSAAGITLGQSAATVLRTSGLRFDETALINTCIQVPTGTVEYRSPAVDFWATDGIVDQIRVHGNYRGSVAGSVSLGTPLTRVEASLGAWDDDDVDTLTVRMHPGLRITLGGESGWPSEKCPDAPVTSMYVYRP